MTAQRKSPIVTFHGLRGNLPMNTVSAPWHSVHWYLGSACPNSHHYGLQLCTVMASKCISKLARLQASKPAESQPSSPSPNKLNYGLHMHLYTRSIKACKHARLRPLNASLNPLAYGLHVHLQSRSIMASMCIFKPARLQPRNTLHHGLQMHL